MQQGYVLGAQEVLARLDQLTRRQREVLARLCEGKQIKEIARDLSLSEQRVYQHLAAIYQRLDLLYLNGYERRMILTDSVCPLVQQSLPDERGAVETETLPVPESEEEPAEAALLLAILDHNRGLLPLGFPRGDTAGEFDPEDAGDGPPTRSVPSRPAVAGMLAGFAVVVALLVVLNIRGLLVPSGPAGTSASNAALAGATLVPTVVTFQLSVTRPWPDDIPVVNVERGQRVLIKASPGTARYCPDCPVAPAGGSREHAEFLPADATFLVPYLWAHALICKIGPAGTPFNVGSSWGTTIAVSGRLYCSINDSLDVDYWGWADNGGSWPVTVTVGTDPQVSVSGLR